MKLSKLLLFLLFCGLNSYAQRISDGTYVAEKSGLSYTYVVLTVNGDTAEIEGQMYFKGAWFQGFAGRFERKKEQLKADEFGQFVNDSIMVKLKNGKKITAIINNGYNKVRYKFKKIDQLPQDYYDRKKRLDLFYNK